MAASSPRQFRRLFEAQRSLIRVAREQGVPGQFLPWPRWFGVARRCPYGPRHCRPSQPAPVVATCARDGAGRSGLAQVCQPRRAEQSAEGRLVGAAAHAQIGRCPGTARRCPRSSITGRGEIARLSFKAYRKLAEDQLYPISKPPARWKNWPCSRSARGHRRFGAGYLGFARHSLEVFAWSQNRHLLTGWYGLGCTPLMTSSLARGAEGLKLLRPCS